MFAKRIIEFLKGMFSGVDIGFLKEGDLIFINRYENRKEKKKLKGHETGPAVIVKKDDQNIYYLSCSGHEKKKELPINRPLLSKKDYPKLSENTYVIPIEIKTLKPKMFLRLTTELTKEDMNRIYRALLLQKEYHPDYLPSDMDFDYQYSVGDIIRYDFSRYYIMNQDDKNYHVLKIYSNIGAENKKKLLINYRLYSIDYSQEHTIPIGSDITLIDHASENMQGLIKSNYIDFQIQEKQRKREEKVQLHRGMLIDIHNDFYYVYGQEKTDFLSYVVYPYVENQSGYKISINNETYLTYFAKHIISNDEASQARIISVATEDEATEIKKERRYIKRQYRNLDEGDGSQLHRGLQPRAVMTDECGKEYLVIYRDQNTIYFVPLDDLTISYEYTINNNQPFNYFFSRLMSQSEFRKIVNNHSYGAQSRRKF